MDSKYTDPQQNANVGQPELRKRLEDAQGLGDSKYSNDLDDWSFAKELESSLTFEYLAPHNRHKSIRGEVDRLMGLHQMLLEQTRTNTIKAAIAELPEKRDQYYGMVCQDFGHCIPGYMDIESVEWWNEYHDQAEANLKTLLGGDDE